MIRPTLPPASAAVLSALAILGAASVASAAPLDIQQLDALATHVACVESCHATDPVTAQVCADSCGDPDPTWDKDGVRGIGRRDLDLANLEVADGGQGTEICYRDGDRIVVPAALCPGALCEAVPACGDDECAQPERERPRACPEIVCDARPARDAQDCADGDGDGIPAWLELATGGDDGQAAVACADHAECGFRGACRYDDALGLGRCLPRDCGDDACTAFHLDIVASDDQQVLVHVVFDHSPVPPTVLDLHIRYDRGALLLADARPLPNLTGFGKELSVRHELGGMVRLVILDRTSDDPIRSGPLVELVFTRISDAPSAVGFTTDDDLQTRAMAPVPDADDQSDRQDELADDDLWGPPAEVVGRGDEELNRLLLWYSFDDEDDPLALSRVPSGEQLCEQVPTCFHEPDPERKAVLVARLSALQAGSVAASGSTTGVSRGGLYLDGGADHVRMPVHLLDPPEASAQSFSLSTWFYAEGASDNELATSSQVLYAHHATNERTAFGFVVDPDPEEGGADLSFFRGDALHADELDRVSIGEGLELRSWHHVAFTLDAALGHTLLYLDGLPVTSFEFPPSPAPVACPAFSSGVNVLLHEEGDLAGGRGPEVSYLSVRRRGLYQIERMDLNGLASTPVLADGAHSFQDVDYLPILNKIAYVTNVSGQFEVWIADGDGGNPQQVTVGFGDAARTIFAKRPRWAPDGSGLIFESNVFSVPDEHNPGLGYQLYFVGYDAVANQVAVDMPDGDTVEQLDYERLLALQSVGAHQVTRGDGNHTGARWLAGRGDGDSRGDVVFNHADELWRSGTVRRLRLPDNLREAAPEVIGGLGDAGTELRMFAAANRRVRVGPRIEERPHLLYERSSADWVPSTQFNVSANTTASNATVVITHAPAGYDPLCWDRNSNHQPPDRDGREADEDRNGDGRFDVADCYPVEALDLFVAYDSAVWSARTEPEDADAAKADTLLRSEARGGLDKDLRLSPMETGGGAFLRVEVRSPRNGNPITPGVVAVLTFDRLRPDAPQVAFSTIRRTRDVELLVDDLTDPDAPEPVTLTDVVDRIDAATFSPDGDRLLLAGISHARPVLLRTRNLFTTSGAEQLLQAPARIRGLTWTHEQRYFACNWIGGTVNPQSKLAVAGFRGGLDDLKVFAGVRDPDSIRSEAERGHEILEVEDRKIAAPGLPTCSVSHSECPPFHLCQEGSCVMVECDPEDPYSCAGSGGRCTLRALSVEQENPGEDNFDWVCAADCAVDPQCFTEACENGPCRFCDDDRTCIECREAVQDFGAFTITNIEGCPDRNSFWCEAGSCQTECYAIRDDQTLYVCDPTLEYCDRGRCVTYDWDWWDLAPSSLGGLVATAYEDVPGVRPTVAVGVVTTVEVQAYGRGDYLHPPELLVQGRIEIEGRTLYGGGWFSVGRIRVDNRTPDEASVPYVLQVPHPLSDLRVRLLNAPYDNLDDSATGLGAWDKDFCLADAAAAGEGDPDRMPCHHRPPGSVFHLGYEAEIPYETLVDACLGNGLGPDCPRADDPLRPYLQGGSPAAIVLGVRVAGASATIERNEVCSYEGTLQPLEPGTGEPRKLFYGDIRRERSNQAAAYCAANPDACVDASPLLDFTAVSEGAYGLLNCNYRDSGSDAAATIEYVVPPYVQDMQAGAIRESANACLVEIDDLRREHCYEFTGGDASLDPLDAPMEIHQTLEFTLPSGFGHDRGFTSVDLSGQFVRVDIDDLRGALVLSNGHETLVVEGNGPTFARFDGALPVGRRYAVAVVSQPGDGAFCVVDPATARGAMTAAGVEVAVRCGPLHPVRGTLEGISGDRVSLRVQVSDHVAGGRVRGATHRTFDVADNGAFAMPLYLPEGATYSVTIAGQPRVPSQLCAVQAGAGEVGGRGVAGLVVTCELVSPRLIGGTVRALEGGGGLRLLNGGNGETLDVEGNGEFEFEGRVMPGEPVSVIVQRQPEVPPQLCVVMGAPAIMPNRDLFDLQVTCSRVPTYRIRLTVVGLLGSDLTIGLNGGEEMTAQSDGQYTFATGLVSGGRYEVGILDQPVEPEQDCQVLQGDGEVAGADVADIQVVCGAAAGEGPAQQYFVSGLVTGVMGHGLYVKVETGTEFFDLPEDEDEEDEEEDEGFALPDMGGLEVAVDHVGRLTLAGPLRDGTYYRLAIKTQPEAPDQVCYFVRNLEIAADLPLPGLSQEQVAARLRVDGRVLGSSVRDLDIHCTPSTAVTMTMDAADRFARAYIVNNDSGMVLGETCDNARQGEMRIVPVGASDCRREDDLVPAAFPGGAYTVFLWVDSEGGGGARASYAPGDLSYRGTFNVPEEGDLTVRIGEALAVAVGEPVTVRGADLPARSWATCYWTPPTGERAAVPVAKPLAVSQRVCALEEGELCFEPDGEVMSGVTNFNGPLPPAGTYDVTCWVDRGGPGGSPNRVLDGPDRIGFAAGVRADGPGIVGSQVVVDMEAP